ncbi:MAG: carboxypeptidase-like regulatory domain-containing protein [Bacteroidota bacterium]
MKVSIYILFIFFAASAFGQIKISGLVIDNKLGEPLAFANVYTQNGDGGITNESGKFVIEVKEIPRFISVSHVGFISQEVQMEEDKPFYLIKLTPSTVRLSEIRVLANDKSAIDLFYQAIVNSRKLSLPIRKSKVFRRTYSTIDKGTPTELMESYYNASMTEGGIRSFDLKNGRVGIPFKNYILQFDICKVLEHYNFYGDNKGFLPTTPLQYRFKKRIEKDYFVRYAGTYLEGQDTIVKINFSAKKMRQHFNGVAFINKNKNYITRVVHEIKNAANIPFETVNEGIGAEIKNMSVKWDTGFEFTEEGGAIKFMQLVLLFDYINEKKTKPLKSNTKLYFYDYGKQFDLPIFGGSEEYLNDYDKILSIPYNAEFWRRTSGLPETGLEERFRRDLEANHLFVNDDLVDGNIKLLNREYQLIHENIRPDWGKVRKTSKKKDAYRAASNMGADTYNCLYARTFFAADFNCFSDTVQFIVKAILDYDGSYMCDRVEKEAMFFIKYLQLADLHARILQTELSEKYKNECPEREVVKNDLDLAEKKLRKEIFTMFNGSNKRNANYLNELENNLSKRKETIQ